jgi:hypothetical protein
MAARSRKKNRRGKANRESGGPADQAVFLALSALLTGFQEIELQGTGLVAMHLKTLILKVGEKTTQELLEGARQALGESDPASAIRNGLWKSPKLGPVIQNLIPLWYVGSWSPMPRQWQEQYYWDHPDLNTSPEWVSAPQSYEEALVWRVIFAHPPGTRPTGFGSWSDAPPGAPRQIAIKATLGGKP